MDKILFLVLVSAVGCGGSSDTISFKEIDRADGSPVTDALAVASGGTTVVGFGGKLGLSVGSVSGSGGAPDSGGISPSAGLPGSGGLTNSMDGSVVTGADAGSGGASSSGGSATTDGGASCSFNSDCPVPPKDGVEQCVAGRCDFVCYAAYTKIGSECVVGTQCDTSACACSGPLGLKCCVSASQCGCTFGFNVCRGLGV